MPASELMLTGALGLALALVAIGVRLGIHVGAKPGGVDTWYFLASAAALRRSRRFPISLPQYLLHDRFESYPPGFIVFLALIPPAWLRRYLWLVSPVIDVVHLLLVYVLMYRLTNNLLAAGVAGAVHALTPQLIAETRSLNPRSFGVLLNSITMYLILRALLPVPPGTVSNLGPTPWFVVLAAILAAMVLFLTTTGVPFMVAIGTLTVVFGDPRYLVIALAGLAAAVLLTRGLYLKVIGNYIHAVRFWRRNIRYRGAHPILDSPLYGDGGSRARPANWQASGWIRSVIRLVGENPFLIPMLFAATPTLVVEWWGQQFYWWALSILIWSFAVTFVRPLRVFGPGHQHMKASVMPTAFSLALLVGGLDDWRSFPGLVVAASFALSVAAIGVFYMYLRTRQGEHTASTPPDLESTAADLARSGGDGVLVLPMMYADFVTFASGKKVLWGGHSGDLSRFEAVYPVIREPLEDLIERYQLDYALLDLAYVDPERLRLRDQLTPLTRHGNFALYETTRSARTSR